MRELNDYDFSVKDDFDNGIFSERVEQYLIEKQVVHIEKHESRKIAVCVLFIRDASMAIVAHQNYGGNVTDESAARSARENAVIILKDEFNQTWGK